MCQLNRRDVGIAGQDGRQLRTHTSRRMEVVVVPMQDRHASGCAGSNRPLLADGRTPRQDEQPHAQLLRRRIRLRAHRAMVSRGVPRRDHDEVGVLLPQKRLDSGRAVVNHQYLKRAVVLRGDLTHSQQGVPGTVARQYGDGREQRAVGGRPSSWGRGGDGKSRFPIGQGGVRHISPLQPLIVRVIHAFVLQMVRCAPIGRVRLPRKQQQHRCQGHEHGA